MLFVIVDSNLIFQFLMWYVTGRTGWDSCKVTQHRKSYRKIETEHVVSNVLFLVWLTSSSSAFDPVLEREIRSSWEKYRHYMTEGTPEGGPEGDGTGTVAPMNQKWVRGALELLPPPPEGVPKELVENLIKDILGEMNEDYENSVRKSILDYVLKSGSEAARLHITVR